MSKYTEDLVDRATAYLTRDEVIPLDLYSELMVAGLNPTEIEENHSNFIKRKQTNGNTI